MQVVYPVSTDIINEAKIYAIESINHTMDYEGWEDQHKKVERIVYGKFGQLWVAEFCKLNGVNFKKDKSSPYLSDKSDLEVDGMKIDVKVSVMKELVGQVSPGVVNADYDFFCFMLVDRFCKWVCPYGLISCENFREIMVKVDKGQNIPGTTLSQRFSESYFLPANSKLVPFVSFFMNKSRTHVACEKPFMMVEPSVIHQMDNRLNALHKLLMYLANKTPQKKEKRVVEKQRHQQVALF